MITPLMTVGAVYTKAFVETLAKYHADALSDAVRTRFRRKGKTREVLVGPDDGSAATIIITDVDPLDEARLALLDPHVTADELRGKVLRWDEKAMGLACRQRRTHQQTNRHRLPGRRGECVRDT